MNKGSVPMDQVVEFLPLTLKTFTNFPVLAQPGNKRYLGSKQELIHLESLSLSQGRQAGRQEMTSSSSK